MKKGFTLLELLVVICIIGILAGLTIVSTSRARAKARDDKRKADMQTVALSLEMYYANQKSYPLVTGWTALGSAITDFISSFPKDPQEVDYFYKSNSFNKKYILDATLEIKDNSAALVIPGCTDTVLNDEDECFKTIIYDSTTDGKTHYRVSGK